MIREIFCVAIAVFLVLVAAVFASVILSPVEDTRNYMPHMVKFNVVDYKGDPVVNETLTVTPVIQTDDMWLGFLSFFGIPSETNDVSNQSVIRTGDDGTAVLHMIATEKYNVSGENFSLLIYPLESEYTIFIRR